VEETPAPPRHTRLILAIVTGSALVWTAGAVLAPWLSSHGSVLGGWLRLVYRPGCHQIAGRCLDLGFGPMAVCARCMGLYLGGCLGLSWTTIRNRSSRPRPVWLAALAVPTVLDFLAGQLGLPSLASWSRLALAVPLGLVAALFLGDALITIVAANSGGSTATREADSVR
jgi:uncharacterized membrane protein